MASERGRGAQVRLDDDTRQYARGGTALKLIDNIRLKQTLEADGTSADGNSADGSTADGTPAEDEVLVPGGDASIVTPGITAPGTGGLYRQIQAKIAEGPYSASDYGSAAALQAAAEIHVVDEVAVERNLQGPDGSTQFRIGYNYGADNFWQVVGGSGVNQAATLIANSDTNTTVDGVVVMQGTGSLYVGGGAGTYLQIKDAGTGNTAVNYVQVMPGDVSVDPTISSTRGISYSVDSGWTHNLKINTATMASVSNVLSASSSDRWWDMSADTTYARFTIGGTATNASAYLKTRGTGSYILANGNGNILTAIQQGAGTIANGVLMRANTAAGGAASVESLGETNAPLTVNTQGTGVLTLGSTTGSTTHKGTAHTFQLATGAVAAVIGGTAPASSDRYWQLGTQGTSGLALLTVAGGGANAGGYIAAAGTGTLTFANGQGNLLSLAPIDSSTTANVPLLRSSATGVAPQIEPLGEANAGLTVRASGTGTLTVGRSTGQTSIAGGVSFAGTQVATLADAGNVAVASTTRYMFLVGGGTIPAYTVTFPTSPADGHVFTITSNVIVTALTCSSASTIDGPVTTINPTIPASWAWNNSNTRWMRV